MADFELISTIIFFSVIGLLLIYDRKNVQFSYGISIRRWKKGLGYIDSIAKRHRKFITAIGNISVVIGIIGGIVGIAMLLLFTAKLQQVFGIVLPSVSGYHYPGPVISIPFWYWIVGIFLIIATHESMHAVYAKLEGVKVKNYGVILFLLLPIGAFVDPDNKQIKKLKTLKKLRILSAGSFINLVTAGIMVVLLILSSNMTNYLFQNSGVSFESTIKETPAAAAGLSGTILKINDRDVKSVGSFLVVLDNIKPSDVAEIETTEGNYFIKTAENPDSPSKAYIGISNVENVYSYRALFSGIVPKSVIVSSETWFRLLYWLTLLSLGVGIANLLPMKPFDGGLIFEELFSKISKTHSGLIIKSLTIVTAGLILFNLFGIGIVRSFL